MLLVFSSHVTHKTGVPPYHIVVHIVKVAWTHSASLLAGRAERFPSKLPGPGQRLHITAKPQLVSNSAGVLPLILAAVQCQYVLTEKKTQLSRGPKP